MIQQLRTLKQINLNKLKFIKFVFKLRIKVSLGVFIVFVYPFDHFGQKFERQFNTKFHFKIKYINNNKIKKVFVNHICS